VRARRFGRGNVPDANRSAQRPTARRCQHADGSARTRAIGWPMLAILPRSMTFRERWRENPAAILRREAVGLRRWERQVAPTPCTKLIFCESKRPSNRNLSGCSFRFNNRRGTVDVDASDAVNESSLFVVQIRGLDVTYNNSNATCHWYICLIMQNRHPI
jgi:hypothetical protein